MNFSLNQKARRQIESRVESGRYRNAEAVISASLAALSQHEDFGSFIAGEMDQLLADGERSIRHQRSTEASKVFAAIRRKSSNSARKRQLANRP